MSGGGLGCPSTGPELFLVSASESLLSMRTPGKITISAAASRPAVAGSDRRCCGKSTTLPMDTAPEVQQAIRLGADFVNLVLNSIRIRCSGAHETTGSWRDAGCPLVARPQAPQRSRSEKPLQIGPRPSTKEDRTRSVVCFHRSCSTSTAIILSATTRTSASG